jgi:hypothetical protein
LPQKFGKFAKFISWYIMNIKEGEIGANIKKVVAMGILIA